MTNFFQLPHERLNAYQEARKLLECIREAEISDGKLRDQALRAGTSVCLNIAEAAGRTGLADRARVFAIARGECCEAGAALDIALAAGSCRTEVGEAGASHAPSRLRSPDRPHPPVRMRRGPLRPNEVHLLSL